MIYPTARAAILAALGAPLALLIAVAAPGLWTLGFGWIFLIGLLVVADAVIAADRRKLTVALNAPAPAYISKTIEVRTELRFAGTAPAVATLELETNAFFKAQTLFERGRVEDGRATIRTTLDTVRRGDGRIERAWVSWRGPLGLITKRRIVDVGREIPVIPDIKSVREEAIRIFARDTTVGQKLHIDRGVGSEFDALREFLQGMDRRTIDWKQSARHTQLLAKEFRTEQDQTVIFAIDTGRVMCEPIGGVPKIDLAINAALLLGYVSLRLGDRVGVFSFDARPGISSGAVSGVKAFPQLQRLTSLIDYSANETNYTLGLTQLSAEVRRRSLVIVFTDFADPTSAELMIENVSRLMRKHLVLFVAIRDAALEDIVQAEPQVARDISRAVIAHSLQAEKDLVLSRLQRLGAEIVDAPADRLGVAILNRYLTLKRQSRI